MRYVSAVVARSIVARAKPGSACTARANAADALER